MFWKRPDSIDLMSKNTKDAASQRADDSDIERLKTRMIFISENFQKTDKYPHNNYHDYIHTSDIKVSS